MKILAWDIETGALPEEDIIRVAKPFEPESVKTGNTKDLKLISDKVEAARQNHFLALKKKAALHAQYSEVVAIGITDGTNIEMHDAKEAKEAEMIKWFWQEARKHYHNGFFLAGHNIKNFDLPYLVRRSFFHRIPLPEELMPARGRFWGRWWLDTMEAWAMGDPQARIGLDSLSKLIGLEGKSGNGKHFARLLETDYDSAMVYLKTDLTLTYKVAEHILPVIKETEIG